MKTLIVLLGLIMISGCASTVMVENKSCKAKLSDGNGNPIVSECKEIHL